MKNSHGGVKDFDRVIITSVTPVVIGFSSMSGFCQGPKSVAVGTLFTILLSQQCMTSLLPKRMATVCSEEESFFHARNLDWLGMSALAAKCPLAVVFFSHVETALSPLCSCGSRPQAKTHWHHTMQLLLLLMS
jgi:hypothetical protein